MQKTLPKGWKIVRLKEVVSNDKFAIVDGPFGTQLHISDFVTEGVPVVGIENVSTNEFVNKNLNYITANKYKELKRSTIRPNDLLITKTGTIGRTCIVPDFIKIGIITSRLAKITLDQSKCFNKYLSYFINYDNQTTNNLKSLCTGSTMPILNLTSLGNLQITLPHLSTQHKIVEILEGADNLRKLRQHADEKMKDLIPSLFIKMFGDPATNPKRWEVRQLKDVALSVKNGLFKRPAEFGAGVPLINVVDLFTGYRVDLMKLERVTATKEEIEKYSVQEGDLFFCRSSLKKEGVAKCAVALKLIEPTVFECHTIMARIDKNALNPLYASIYLNHPGVRTHTVNSSQTATMTTVGQKDILRQNIFLPPLPLQQEFAKIVENIAAEKARQAESRKKLDELFQSLMQRAFTGELVA